VTQATTCPGAAFYAQIGAIARQAANFGLPKLYTPSVRGAIGGQVRFQARLSEPLPWTVTVADSTGNVVATGTGESQGIDWTWDAAAVVPGSYSWAIAAGDTVRPASGTIGAKAVALAITSATAVPRTITPNGDGQTDFSQISYTLSAPATVTATLRGPDGRDLSVLFSQQKRPGKQSFRFAAAGVADGRYEIVVSAYDGRVTVTSVVPFSSTARCDGSVVTPVAVSPNGDGSADDATFEFELTRASARLDIARGRQDLGVRVLRGPAGRPANDRWTTLRFEGRKVRRGPDGDERHRNGPAHGCSESTRSPRCSALSFLCAFA
jgi:hypothetical protein